MTVEGLIWEDAALRRLAYAVRDGDMTIEGALKDYAAYQTSIAEVYRKLAEDALSICQPIYYLCAHCAKERA